MFSSPIAFSLILCLFAVTAQAIDWSEVSADAIRFTSIEEKITKSANLEEQRDIALQNPDCDCGPNSEECKLENGKMICKCKYSYRQENDVCEAFCEDHWSCENEAKCINESCQCLPGTSGDFCEIADACDGMKGPLLCGDPHKVYCRFDVETQKTECHCRIMEYLYHPKLRECVECICGEYGSCSLVEGKKTCKCNEFYAVKKVSIWGEMRDTCEVCSCGNNSKGCSFQDDVKICDCEKGFRMRPSFNGECAACDCGPHSTDCKFEDYYPRKECSCMPGYIDKGGVCTECDCGKNGVCSFKGDVKQCDCSPGYALRDGICTACQCYAGDETVPCIFTNNIQKCQCPDGYETTKFICKDIDECLNSSNSCPPTTDCFNTMGSYECVCKDGYVPVNPGSDLKSFGCEDIDECLFEELCPRNHTICTNLPGNYTCVCENGYVPVPPNSHPKDAGCEKAKEENMPAWKIVLIVLGVIFIIFFATCVAYIKEDLDSKFRLPRRSPRETDTTLEYIR